MTKLEKKIGLAVHGGADVATPFLKQNLAASEKGLKEALTIGYEILKKGGDAIIAVGASIKYLEDNPIFNAGRGSALNQNGEVEMDASIMDGKNMACGAVSMVRSVKNPILLAKTVMEKTKHVFLSGYGALELAKNSNIELCPDEYFITDHKLEEYLRRKNASPHAQNMTDSKTNGTVGAVALDQNGNIAAGTSTGGTSFSLPGRIGDTCVIGAGCYADNETCAISGTGEGEYLIRGVVAHTIATLIKLKGLSLQDAINQVILHGDERVKGEMGVIGINTAGDIAVAFNTEIMRRGWIDADGNISVHIY